MFYVYLIIDPRNDQVIYVGKGQNTRHKDHWRPAMNGYHCNPKLMNKLRKIASLGYCQPKYDIVFRASCEQDALDEEVRLIAHFGRANLCNLTDGGEGTTGCVHSEESRRKSSHSLKAFYSSLSVEERCLRAQNSCNSLTHEQRSIIAKRTAANMGPEYWANLQRKRIESSTPEQRSEWARKANAAVPKEVRSALSKARRAEWTAGQNLNAAFLLNFHKRINKWKRQLLLIYPEDRYWIGRREIEALLSTRPVKDVLSVEERRLRNNAKAVAYYYANHDEMLAKGKRTYQKNKGKPEYKTRKAKNHRDWRASHKEHCSVYNKQWQERNRKSTPANNWDWRAFLWLCYREKKRLAHQNSKLTTKKSSPSKCMAASR